MSRIKKIDDYRVINSDSKRKIKYILNDIPKNGSTVAVNGWQCMKEGCGYIWSAYYFNIYNGKRGCPKCAGTIPKTIGDYRMINSDEKRKIKYMLDDIPKNVSSDAENGWQCMEEGCGYIWTSTYDRFYHGKRGCSKCARVIPKTMEDYRMINSDEKRKIKYILNDIPKNTSTNAINGWQCMEEGCGYVWSSRYNDIYNKKTGCMKCAGLIPRTLEDYRIINSSETRKIKYILDNIPQNIKTYSNNGWKCMKEGCGHIWSSTYDNIYHRKRGCPNCASLKSEKQCRYIFETIMEIKFDKSKPKFLKGLEYDGYNDKYKLAFEFNGIQHYKYSSFFHKNGEIDFEEQLKRDKLKIKLSIENNIQLIIIPYTCDSFEKMELFIKRELYIRDFYFEFYIDPKTKEMIDILK